MSQGELPPMDEEVLVLLQAERLAPEPPSAVRNRVRDAVFRSVLGPGSGQGPEGGGEGIGGKDPAGSRIPESTTTSASGSAGPLSSTASATTGGVTSAGGAALAGGLTIPLLVGVFALGGIAGAIVHSSLAPPKIERVVIEVPAASPASRIDEAARGESTTETLELGGRDAPGGPAQDQVERRGDTEAQRPGVLDHEAGRGRLKRKSPVAATPAGPENEDARIGDTLELERALVDRARSALARGQAGQARLALEEHRRQFDRGHLREERMALEVQALSALGDRSKARLRAEEFRVEFPRSLFGPVVEAAAGP